MVFTYKECIETYGTDYKMKKEMQLGKLFQIEKGIYTDDKYCSELEVVSKKYPRAVYAGESAFYYHGLTDVIPEKHVLATLREDSRIQDDNVRQIFVKKELFLVGKTKMSYNGHCINIYSRERLLVDMLRSKSKYGYDYYKEVIRNYRYISEELDYFLIEEYAKHFRNSAKIMEAIQLEVL